MTSQASSSNRVVGVIPAAGRGTRLGPQPFSKELYPLGYRVDPHQPERWLPVPVIEDVVSRMASAGVERIVVVLSRGKGAIMDYLAAGDRYGVDIAYLVQEELGGMPHALDLAAPWIGGDTTVFGMPDTLVRPKDAYQRLLAHHHQQKADVTLGLFPTNEPHRFGMVELDAAGTVIGSIDKPKSSALRYMWGFACWSPRFTELMSTYLREQPATGPERLLASVFQHAIEKGLAFSTVRFDEGQYVDIGTVEVARRGFQRFVDD